MAVWEGRFTALATEKYRGEECGGCCPRDLGEG